jgi:hypothetical protein
MHGLPTLEHSQLLYWASHTWAQQLALAPQVPPPGGSHVTQVPAVHVATDEGGHTWHAPPAVPQAALVLPGSHVFADEQQPVHEVPSHTQLVPLQWSPVSQVPVPHVPPQPSGAPQTFPAQRGGHPHTPG